MPKVSGTNRTNRPYFFEAGPDRVEFPAMGYGEGELDGRHLDEFNALVRAGQIEVVGASIEGATDPDGDHTPKRGRPRKVK